MKTLLPVQCSVVPVLVRLNSIHYRGALRQASCLNTIPLDKVPVSEMCRHNCTLTDPALKYMSVMMSLQIHHFDQSWSIILTNQKWLLNMLLTKCRLSVRAKCRLSACFLTLYQSILCRCNVGICNHSNCPKRCVKGQHVIGHKSSSGKR